MDIMWTWLLLGLLAGAGSIGLMRFSRQGGAGPWRCERAEAALESLSEAVITTDREGVIDYLNPRAEGLLERPAGEVIGRPLDAVLHMVDDETGLPVPVPLRQSLEHDRPVKIKGELCLIAATGRRHPVNGSVAPMRDSAGAVRGGVLLLQDVGRSREMSHLLAYQASHDDLTGLVNRREFERQVQQAIDSVHEQGRRHVLCYLDLDQFRVINDTCGHLAGDALLKKLAEALRRHVRDTDVLARLGGDEFGLLFRNCEAEDAVARAEELRETVRRFRFGWEEKTFEVAVSMGMVPLTREHHSMTEVMSLADSACYVAKERGGARIHVYQADDDALIRRQGEMQWVHRITEAYAENRFVLYAQEVVPLQARTPDEQRYEVLLRMLDDSGELVLPMEYIRAAERYNMMADLDRWVISNAFAVIGRYLDRRREEPRLPVRRFAVNLSGQSLGDERTVEFVQDQLARYPELGQHIIFEITETAAVSNLAQATRFISTFRELGCRFALDDFGTGVSSFAHLKNLDVDYLKIDGAFVRDLSFDPVNYAMVGSINHIGHVMNIKTIAEYVETAEIRDQLRDIGVDFGQGNWLSRPVRLSELVNG